MPETVWRGWRYLSMKKLDECSADRGEGGRGGGLLLSVWWRLWHCKKKSLQPILGWKICGRGKVFKEPSLVDHNKDLINVPSPFVSMEFEFCPRVDALRCKSAVGGDGVNLLLTRLQPPSWLCWWIPEWKSLLIWLQCCTYKSQPDWSIYVIKAPMTVCLVHRQTLADSHSVSCVSTNTGSTARGSWSCVIQILSWERGRRTSGARTHVCGWFSEFTSTRLQGERCPCRLRPTPLSAVSTSSHTCFSLKISSVNSSVP